VIVGGRLAELWQEAMTALPQVLVNVKVRSVIRTSRTSSPTRSAQPRSHCTRGTGARRASGTEPLVRVMVEAPTAEQAQRAAEELAHVVERRWS
jgi:phosphoglucosamine mutase